VVGLASARDFACDFSWQKAEFVLYFFLFADRTAVLAALDEEKRQENALEALGLSPGTGPDFLFGFAATH
jgi:hypothetical protein